MQNMQNMQNHSAHSAYFGYGLFKTVADHDNDAVAFLATPVAMRLRRRNITAGAGLNYAE